MSRNNNFKIFQNLALLSQIGLMMAVYIVGSVMLGGFLDDKFGTSPILMILCLLIGIVAAFFNVFRMLFKIGATSGEEDKWKK